MDFFLGEELPDADRARLRRHVEELAEQRGLEWREQGEAWLDGEGSLKEKWFSTPPLTTEMDYFAALHEVGHHELGLPTFAEDGETVLFENEERVWGWALDNAIVTPSGGTRGRIIGSLLSHEGQKPPLDVRKRFHERLGDGGVDPMQFK